MFTVWFDRFLSEKGIDLDRTLEVEGPSGLNLIPVECLVDAIKSAPAHEQTGIKHTVVKLDFLNQDVMGYFNHLARAIAV